MEKRAFRRREGIEIELLHYADSKQHFAKPGVKTRMPRVCCQGEYCYIKSAISGIFFGAFCNAPTSDMNCSFCAPDLFPVQAGRGISKLLCTLGLQGRMENNALNGNQNLTEYLTSSPIFAVPVASSSQSRVGQTKSNSEFLDIQPFTSFEGGKPLSCSAPHAQ